MSPHFLEGKGMSEHQAISDVARGYLRLHLTNGVGPITLRRLIAHFGGAAAVLSASADALRRVDGIGRTISNNIREAASSDRAGREIDLAVEHGVRIICPEDEEYPPLLKHTPDGPVCLYVKGRLQPQDGVSLAVVGSRKPSYYGQEQARRFAEGLAAAGMTIVSGLAYGVDASAHQGALAGGGRTVAVLGNGLSDIYPSEHRDLAERICANGAVVSELPMETPPDAGNFPRRNRIITGMSLGVLIVEGTDRSGALITARLANEYNREVFALPGRIDCQTSHGPNALIRQGAARLVTCVADLFDDLGEVGRVLGGQAAANSASETPGQPAMLPDLKPNEQKVLGVLNTDPMPIEMIVDTAELSPAEVSSALTTLQLKRRVRQLPGNQFVRVGL
jgi:DNA processing protein